MLSPSKLISWNAERAASAVPEQKSPNTLYTFDMSLKHHLNRLHMSLCSEPFLLNFTLPGVFTGERIGVEYLISLTKTLIRK